MNILDKIVETKRNELVTLKRTIPESLLRDKAHFHRTCNSLKSALLERTGPGIIAEFKQKSPSKGIINGEATVETVTRGYATAGAVGLSVLTDEVYFGGNLGNLEKARAANPGIPILRKDFMVDTYQVTEAKASGADVILLIAACLEKEKIHDLAHMAKELGLEILLEIHGEDELEKISPLVDMVGVNNRNLKTFEVDLGISEKLSTQIPGRYLKITESGIAGSGDILHLFNFGYKGFLTGETFMKTSDPAKACQALISEINFETGGR